MSTAVLARPTLPALPPRPAPGRVLPEPAARSSAQNSASPASPARKPLLNFARTKIQPPRARPGALLQRPALQQRLVHALGTMPLVLVCATAGFGKTSALTQAIDQLQASHEGAAVAWVGCDEGDTPLQLFSCLVAALEPFDLPWRAAPESLISAALSGNARALPLYLTSLAER